MNKKNQDKPGQVPKVIRAGGVLFIFFGFLGLTGGIYQDIRLNNFMKNAHLTIGRVISLRPGTEKHVGFRREGIESGYFPQINYEDGGITKTFEGTMLGYYLVGSPVEIYVNSADPAQQMMKTEVSFSTNRWHHPVALIIVAAGCLILGTVIFVL